MPKVDYTIKIFLEDSARIKELEQQVEFLENQLQEAKAKVKKAEYAYICEIERSMKLNDELRALNGRNLRNR